MEGKKAVQHFVCPTVHVPDDLRRQNNTRNTKRPAESAAPIESKYISKAKKLKKDESLGDMLKSVRDLGSSGLTGQARLKYKNDKLTKLGAPPPKEQTMPFKMKMGILAGRKKRELKQIAESKVSNLVYPKTHFSTKQPKTRERTSEAFDFEPKTYRGVFKMGKDKMPRGTGDSKPEGRDSKKKGKLRRGT